MNTLGSMAGIFVVLGAACGTATGPLDPGDASYDVVYNPGRVVHATVNCDRAMTHAVIGMGRRDRGFDLSINLYDDCSRAGGGFTFWEVLILGHYTVTDTLLTFTPESGATPPFPGSFDAAHVRFTLPARSDSLAPTPIDMELGDKVSF